MSWNILPKNVLQYFLTKLKGLMYTKTEVDNLIPTVTADGAKQGVDVDSGEYRAALCSYNPLDYGITGATYVGDFSSRTYDLKLDLGGRLVTVVPWEEQVNSDWNATSGKAEILNKPSLATVATSGSYNDLSNKPTIPDISTKVSKSGDTMTGTLSTNTENNAPAINFRPGNANWYDTVMAQTTGNEAVVFASKNAATSWIFVNGEDSYANHSSDRWQSLTPGLQIKNNKVAIGKLIGNSTTPTHALDVNGNVQATTFNGYTIAKSVPSNAVFTDTNNAVTVSHSNSNAEYPLCWEGHNNATTYTGGLYKCTALTVNPYHAYLYVKHTSNGTFTIINSTGIYFRGNTNARIWCGGSQQIWIAASDESDYKLFFGVADSMWTLCPGKNGYVKLGSPNYKWAQIYSTSGSINTSDRKEKKDIIPLDDSAKDFIMALNPVSYKMINGDSGRTHYGMIAQDVEEELDELGMTAMDFAGFCKDQKYERYEEVVDKVTTTRERKVEGEYIYGLRYEEFIAPLIKTVQLQQQEIEELKHRIDILEGK